MKMGLQINRFDSKRSIVDELRLNATAAEDSGFDSLWVMDHFFQIAHLGNPQDPMLEAYTTLGFLAGITKKVTLGTMVTGVIYRAPAILVKIITTLDDVSNGRAILGIGAGWNEEEAIGLGLERPLQNARFERLEETLKIALQMWSGDESPIAGKHYQLEKPILSPVAVQKPHPPILIGGGGEQKTLKLVAKYGDACNLFARSDVKHKLEVLKSHCADEGTDYERIEKTVLMGMPVSQAATHTDEVLARCSELAELGIHHVIFSNDQNADEKSFQTFTDKLTQSIHQL